MPSSSQKPMRMALTPAESTSVSSVRLPDAHHDLRIGIPPADFEVTAQGGREAEADRLDDRVDAERHALAIEEGDGLRRVHRGSRARPGSRRPPTPQATARSRLLASTLSTNSAPAATASATTSAGRSYRSRPSAPPALRAATASRTPSHLPAGSQPRSITSAPSSRNRRRLCQQLLHRQPGCMIDLGQDLDLIARHIREAAARPGRSSEAGRRGRRALVPRGRRPTSPGPGRGRRRSDRAGTTLSTPAGTSRWRAIHRGVMRAATVMGMTATSASNPARGASRSRTWRRANSASRPVTNRYRGRSGHDR